MKTSLLKIIGTGSVSSLVLIGSITAATAQTTTQILEEIGTLQFYPPDEGLPEDTTSGASRDSNCLRPTEGRQIRATLLTPENHLGRTQEPRPELFVLLEDVTATQFFVSVQDTEGDDTYQAFYPLNTSNGLVALPLPEDAPDLAIGRTYRWSVVAVCGQQLRPDDPVLTSFVKRVEPDTAIAQLPTLDRLEAYAESGLWYDTLALLQELQPITRVDETSRPAWESLLLAGGLGNMFNTNSQ
jgi:hypothetical protein